MKVGIIVVGLLTGAAVAVAGCSEETTVIPTQEQPAGISVSATGSALGKPDVAVLTVGVSSDAATVREAREAAATRMDAMIDAFKDGGVEDKDIQTTHFSVQPRYNFDGGRQEIIGFTASNTATVKIRDIDTTGELIDDALDAGGNLARIEQLSFTIDDPTLLEDEARADAMGSARSKAETLAEEGSVELGAPISISEGQPAPVPIDFAGDAAERIADGGTTPIELGELEVQVVVQVTYAID